MAKDRRGVLTSYEEDFVEWAEETAELLRSGRFGEVDVEHLAEEVEDLGKSARAAVGHQLQRMLLHLLKQRIQPERAGTSWRRSIHDSRSKIEHKLDHSPSLKRQLEQVLPTVYRRAVRDAANETGVPAARMPAQCPWTLEELIEGEPE
jgi:hypothetical protein